MCGFRVIAVAYRPLDSKLTWHQVQRIKRDQVEQDLTFLGLLVMQNTLKPETTPVIHQLQNANVRSVMITGDNILTAISVARDCGMVPSSDSVIVIEGHPPAGEQLASLEFKYAELPSKPENGVIEMVTIENESYQNIISAEEGIKHFHFALSGKSWSIVRNYFPSLIQRIVVRGTVFARMSPEQKTQLVESFQELGYIVAMCGDGANDCGALKTAHVGISLSEAEASVAAPFTSKIPNITCVPTVIREGRCALVTSFGVFKYMALYSMIQFISVLILYAHEKELGDLQYLYIDLAITTTVAILMGRTGPCKKLVARRPLGSLISATNLFSIITQILLVITFEVAAFMYLTSQSWYTPTHFGPDEDGVICWETTVIFSVSCYQYLIVAVVFSQGKPFRKPFYTNVLFSVSLVVLTSFTTVLVIYPWKPFADFFELQADPKDPTKPWVFRIVLILLAGINFMVSCVIEVLIVNSLWLKRAMKNLTGKKFQKNRYKLVQQEMAGCSTWPRVGEKEYSTAVS